MPADERHVLQCRARLVAVLGNHIVNGLGNVLVLKQVLIAFEFGLGLPQIGFGVRSEILLTLTV